MVSPSRVLAAIFSWGLAGVVVLGGRAYAEDGTTTGCALTVELEWPASAPAVSPFELFLAKADEGGAAKRVTEGTRPKDNRYVFPGLAPGRYVLEPWEWVVARDGIVVHEEITIPPGVQEKHLSAKVRPVERVTLKVTLKPQLTLQRDFYGRLWYGRHAYNENRTLVTVGREYELRLVADEPYTFRYEPESSHIAPATFGPVVPRGVAGGELVIPVKVEVPALTYRCSIAAVDGEVLTKAKSASAALHRIEDDGAKRKVQGPGVMGVDQLLHPTEPVGPDLWLYGLEDGTYEMQMRLHDAHGGGHIAILASPLVRFTVRDGKASPSNITLRLGQNEVGRIRVTLHDARGKPMPEAPVAIQDGAAGVYSGRTDAEGHMTTPTLLCGTYDILTSGGSHPLLRQRVDVKPGVNPVVLSYRGLVPLRGSVVLASGRTPALFEGSFYPRLDLAEEGRIGSRTGTFEIAVMPDAFPMLILVYAGGEQERPSHLPAIGAVILDEPPSGDVRVTASDAPARPISADLPRRWLAADRSQAHLWFCHMGTIVPVAVCRLGPGGPEPAEAVQAITLSGEARLKGGAWDMLLRHGVGGSARMTWLGSVTVPPTGPIQLTLADEDIRAEGTLAEVREALKSQVNRPSPDSMSR